MINMIPLTVHGIEITFSSSCEPVTIRNDLKLIVVDTEVEFQACTKAVFIVRHQSRCIPRSERTCNLNYWKNNLFRILRIFRSFTSSFNNLYFCYPKAGTTGITVDTHIFCVFNTFGNNKDRICGSTIRLKRLRVTL